MHAQKNHYASTEFVHQPGGQTSILQAVEK